jgi:hypothetical protein
LYCTDYYYNITSYTVVFDYDTRLISQVTCVENCKNFSSTHICTSSINCCYTCPHVIGWEQQNRNHFHGLLCAGRWKKGEDEDEEEGEVADEEEGEGEERRRVMP